MDQLDDVWATRNYPLLCEITRRIDGGERSLTVKSIAAAIRMDEEEAYRGAAALERRGFITGRSPGGSDTPKVLRVIDVSASAYLITGLHPDGDDALSRLIAGLRGAADMHPDEDERGRLRRAADALGGVARDIGVQVVTAVITKQAGG